MTTRKTPKVIGHSKRHNDSTFDYAFKKAIELSKHLPPAQQIEMKRQLFRMGSAFSRASLALDESLRHGSKMEALATIDELSGLPNRRGLRQALTHELDQIARYRDGRSVAVAYADLDGFKAVNDNLGHEAGDHVIQIVAKNLQNVFRKTDTVTRSSTAGDEFILVLPLAANEHFDREKIHEKIWEAFAGLNFWKKDEVFPIGVSIGVASTREKFFERVAPKSLAAALMKVAEARMYRDKWGPTGKEPKGYKRQEHTYIPPKDQRLELLTVEALRDRAKFDLAQGKPLDFDFDK